MIQCPNCKAEIEVRAVAANTSKAITPAQPNFKDVDSVGALLHGIDMDSLNPYETEFITGIRERYEQYGDRIKMSDKQMTVLRKIAGKTF